jgi:membrane protein
MTAPADDTDAGRRSRIAGARSWLEQLLLWRVWERMLEIEFVDRSVALAAKAFVSFFPTVIIVAAFTSRDIRTSIISTLTHRLGMRGEALQLTRDAFASAEHIRTATGVLGLILTIFFATSFTTALQRVFLHAWRRPPRAGTGAYVRGVSWLLLVLVDMAILGALRDALGNGLGLVIFALATLAVTSALWWFSAWFLMFGDVRGRVLVAPAVITGVAMSVFGATATIWMPNLVTENEAQFGFFGVALALVTWFSGAAICILVGACAGPVLAEDTGWVGRFIRGTEDSTLVPSAAPSLAPPARELTLRDAFQSNIES